MKLPRLPYLGGRALKYGYSNARVKGMKGLLLKKSELDELLKVKNIDAVVELLQRTHYREELAKLSLLHRGSTLVELAAGSQFAKVAKKVLTMAPSDDRKVVEALLKRWDVLNLKTVVGARRAGKKWEEVRSFLVPVGSLSVSQMEMIFQADDRTLLEQIRRTDFGKDMLAESSSLLTADAMAIFRGGFSSMDGFLQLQVVLDAYAYAYVEKHLASDTKDAKSIKALFRKEIDAKNVAIVERLKARGTQKEKIKSYVIRGGTLNDAAINALIEAKDFAAVLGIASKKLTGLEGEKADRIKDLPALEIALEKALTLEKVRTFYRSILSIGTLLGFLLLKEEELHNLRKIAKGKEFNLPEEKLRETLVIV
jgi:V/A-type H+-transporting ATPase subunit C